MRAKVVEIADAIRSFVANGPVPGTRLAGSLRSRFPDWNPSDFDVRSLREFVSTRVPGVVVAGRSGMDVVYALEGAVTDDPASVPAVPATADFWRIWVSPNSPYELAVDRTDLTMRAVQRSSRTNSDSIRLIPPAADVHRSFARDFLATVPLSLRPRLETALDSPSEQWWQEWNRELVEPALAESWSRFRQEMFEQRLAEELRAEELERSVIDRVRLS